MPWPRIGGQGQTTSKVSAPITTSRPQTQRAANQIRDMGYDGGPRAFAKLAGLRLEFAPINDPGHVHVGDTLHVKILGNGKPVAGIGIEAAAGLDSAAGATESVTRIGFTADANGIVHVPLSVAGPVMLRSAYASHKVGSAANMWDVSRTTYVFNVGARH